MRKPISSLFIIMTMISLLASSCEVPNLFLATPTITPSQTPTPVCPPELIATPGGTREYRRLIIILIEDSPKYRDYALQGIAKINEILPQVVGPGDDIIMLKMEPFTIEEAVFVKTGIKNLDRPEIPPTPTRFPTPTGTPPPKATPQTRINQIGATQDAMATASSIFATATHSTFLHNCAMNDWGVQYQSVDEEWQNRKGVAIQEFMTEVIDEEKEFLDDDPTPRYGTWNGLSLATILVKNECIATGKYDKCMLVIFSDMDDVTTTKPEGLEIDLSDSEVLGIMLGCNFLFLGECNRWRTFWMDFIQAKSVNFINENVEESIKAFLRR